MARQLCVRFVQHLNHPVPIEKQIQEYLDEHPTYKVNSCSYLIMSNSKEALIIFYDPEKKTHNPDEDD